MKFELWQLLNYYEQFPAFKLLVTITNSIIVYFKMNFTFICNVKNYSLTRE